MYTAYYIEREDGDADLCAVVATGEIILEDLAEDLKSSVEHALTASEEQWFTLEEGDNRFPDVLDRTSSGNQEATAAKRYTASQFDGSTFVVIDEQQKREICACSNYKALEDAKRRAQKIADSLNLAEGRAVV